MHFLSNTGTQLVLGLMLCGVVTWASIDMLQDDVPPTPAMHALPVSHTVSSYTTPTANAAPVVSLSSRRLPHVAVQHAASSVSAAATASGRSSSSYALSCKALQSAPTAALATRGGGSSSAVSAAALSYAGASSEAHTQASYASLPVALHPHRTTTQVTPLGSSGPSGGGTLANPYNSELDVYGGDNPGVITGEENSSQDNPIVSCYGLPIGDALLPLLFLVLLYAGCQARKKKQLKQHLSMISTTPHTSTSSRKRFSARTLLLCALYMLPLTHAWAWEGQWSEHTEAITPDGNFYEVHTAEQLAWVAQQVNSGETFAGKTVSMRADVDLSAHNWQPIGQNGQYTFAGTFEGNAHVISGMTIEETYTEYYPVDNGLSAPGYGLFGSINGGTDYASQTVVVRNVVLENPSITLHVAGENKFTRVGLLAGSAGVKTTIRNCNILGGQIQIDGVPEQDGGTRFFVGGAIGGSAHGFAGAYTEQAHHSLTLEKLVVEANITINPASDYVLGHQHTQNNVGGIIGRLRYGYKKFDQVLYTGTIDARQFTVSPSFGAWCNAPNGSNTRDLTKENYTGDVVGDWFDQMTSVYFTTYQIKQDKTTTVVTDNNLTAGTTTTGTRSLRTLSTNYIGSTQDMYAFQGVNAGTYTADASSLVNNFNSGLSSDRYEWKADGSRLKLHRKDDIKLEENSLALDVSFVNGQPTRATDVTYNWTKNGIPHTATYRVDMPNKILAPITWEVQLSYQLNGNTYYTNTCSYTQTAPIVPAPTISLDGATSVNTLTLTATLDNQELTLDNVVYCWQKDSDEETEGEATKAVTALTPTPTVWHVYAKFKHNGIPYQTEPATYTQLPPEVTLAHTTNNNVLTVTPSMETYGGAITNIRYFRVNGTDTTAYDASAAKSKGYAFSFEEQEWYIYATYQVGDQDYTSPIAVYTHPAARFPELTITHQGSTLTANLIPSDVLDFATPTYTWTKDGQAVGGTSAEQTIATTFADQVWTAKANMTVNGVDTFTNLVTYIVPSSVGDIQVLISENGNTLTGSLNTQPANAAITYTWKNSKGKTSTGTTYTKEGDEDWVVLTVRIEDDETHSAIERTASYQFSEYNVVYINYTGGGSDYNSGRTADKPVATWKKAYSLLTPGVDWDKNIIVITSKSGSSNMIIKEEDTEGKAATITGEWPWNGAKQVTGGIILCSGGTTYNGNGARIGAPTKFKNVIFYGNEAGKTACRLSCHLHDVYFDTGVVMKNFGDLDKSSGALAGHKSPHFHLQLYGDQLNNGTFPQDPKKVMNVTIKSGQFGRILGSRIAGTKAISTYIIGRHDNPLKANITIDIEDVANNKTAGGVNYTDDIGYIAAGLTQGMMWGDVTINVIRGSIATLVAGSQGNALKMGSVNVPVSTFCGRTVVNLLAVRDEDVVIDNYYGACQGRVYGSDGVCDAFFYGTSTLNMRGGTIKSNIFASSAGISGLRSADPDYFAKGWYTPDQRIPYAGSYAYGIDYLPYDRNKSIVTMTTHDGTIDLSETKITVNISGGVVEKNVYGASYGNSETLDNVNYAPAHAGRLFGNTSVNISGGTIEGSVYGGGAGSTRYFDLATTDARRRDFLDVAQVYGNTNVTITGGDIRGNIYAGGGGVAYQAAGDGKVENEFVDIAKVYGTTNLTINCPSWTNENPFQGNIYGGGALAGVEGATSVHIENGVILGDIYAGGAGEDGHPAKARVEGHTFVDLGDQVSRDIEEVDVEVFGNVYGGGQLAQVVTPTAKLSDYLIRDSDLGTLFNKVHTYTTHVRLGENSHVYGQVFGGGEGKVGDEAAGLVVGQTDVVLDGSVTWAEIYGGGRMADVQGNTLVHFKKGRAGHNAFGGGLGLLTATEENGQVLPDNLQTVLASADIQTIPDFSAVPTGNTFVVFDGTEEEHTTYEFEKARTVNRDGEGKPELVDGLYYTETDQYHPELHASHLFSIDHNIYGGGQTAADVAGNTYVHIRYGMVDEAMLNYTVNSKKVWSTIYNSIANPQFCVFGGGYGYYSEVEHDSYVTMAIFGSGNYHYIGEFTQSFVDLKDKWHWDTNVGTRENIYGAADEATWSHGAPGRSAMDIIGGGYNGKVKGTAHVSAAGDIVVRKVYGGGYYASVGNTDVQLNAGIFDRVYGGGMIGNVEGIARLTLGQQALDYTAKQENMHLMVKDAVYGGNDVSGTVGYNTVSEQPIDDETHGVRLDLNGGLILGDVYGAGNGHHPGYTNPDYVDFDLSQHPRDNYTILEHAGANGKTSVYKYRPRVGRVVMNLHGNEGENFNDNPQIDKLRIWGRTFGGGNSCNVGIWNSEGFQGGGTIAMNIGSHVQLGNGDDSHDEPNGLFMGSNGEHMVTQHDAEGMLKYYHHYWDGAQYTRGFARDNEEEFTKFVNTIQTWSDNVSLNVANDVADVWMTNFVGGGFRGSMKAKTEAGHFHYTLPRGVTVGHSVVGGAFNAHVIYTEDTDTIYTYNGGMMSDGSERKHVIWGEGCDFTSDGTGYTNRKDNALVKLELYNMLMPVVHAATATEPENVHGGIVYGGCFKSGFVDGDTWVDYHCSLSPLCTNTHYFNAESEVLYDEVADMEKNNALLVFGAGYGEDTHTMGDVYLRVISKGSEVGGKNVNYPFVYNVFGGSNLGEVSGNTNVYYDGGKHGALFGSLYGGSYKGNIGGNSFVELTNGFVANVYGGSRQANIDGAAHVWAYDGSTRSAVTGIAADGSNRLIICNLYGGNDISGTIRGTMSAKWSEAVWPELVGKTFHSYVQVSGTEPGTHGFPLVGSLYGGGNGEQWSEELGAAPDVERALVEVDGGTTLRAFGGGNKATVTDSAFILVNATSAQFANVQFDEYQKAILNKTFFRGTHGGYRWDGTRLVMESHHVGGLFGGNNQADMTIQPTWNLLRGKVGAVYSGGNMGRMTHEPGIELNVESDNMEIGNLFGGCRMADVTGNATLNVSAGRIGNIYGGNDVAGKIHGVATVNLTGAVSGNVYGAGNGDYLYRYCYQADSIGQIVERKEQTIGGVQYDLFFDVYGHVARASAAEKLRYINDSVRPNVAQSTIYVSGESEQNKIFVTGNIFCGGNAATIRKVDANSFMHFHIGSHVVLNNVFLGSNGESLTQTDNATKFAAINGFSFNTNALLHNYMEAVDIDGLPDDFAISDTLTDAYIGTFCVGGNRGSMTTTAPIQLTFPASITIYNKIIGGCNNAYFSYGGYSYTGGMTGWNTDRSQPKIKLDIYSKFEPKKLNTNTLAWDATVADGRLNDKYCNVYGGCYTRGYVYGDVAINMYSDMVGEFDKAVLNENIAYNETHGRPVFSVFGGGYGPQTVVYGNTHIRLLNENNTITNGDDPLPLATSSRFGERVPRSGGIGVLHPSVNAIYGGGEQGKMIGTSTIHIADGTVYSNVVGGALNGSIYGNTEILVGYPSYYEVQKTGEYKLKRSNFTAEELAFEDGAGNKAVKQSIFLTKGDRINAAVYQAIRDWDTEKGTHQADALVLTQNKVQKNWDDIDITIKGGIYGGGYARENVEDGQTAMANTVLRFTGTYNLATAHPELWTVENTLGGKAIDMQGEYAYGGNSTIWVQDAVNANNFATFNEGVKKEHITITTETDPVAHTGRGGIFGDGHSSLVAAFRSAAVEGYGYAAHPANAPKLLNTFQRFDILQIRDCAMKMYGQIDVATGQNDPTLYSVSRISELMLNSHIDDRGNLLGTDQLNSRNVIDFYNPVHFLGSITSEVTFKPGVAGSRYHNMYGVVNNDSSYYDYKSALVALNYDYEAHGISAVTGCKEAFARRNVGTAKNMIRIDDPEGRGVHLKVVQENNYAVNSQGVREEQSFYGPLSGVFEFELTHANARGGGYVYSNNLHEQTIEASGATIKGNTPSSESFLQTSGNVFFKPVTIGSDKTRQVYDDCYPIPFSEHQGAGVEKAHYWFVEGDGPTWCTYPNKPERIDNGNSTIHIRTAEELAWLYDYIDHGYDSNKTVDKGENDIFPGGFAGWKVVLDNDINLEQLTILDQREMRMIWCPIADVKDAYFKGTFDGQGHKIDGMLLDVDFITTKNTYGHEKYATGYDHYFGLFAKTKDAVVKNVELSAALVRNSGGNENEMVHIGTLITQVDGTEVVDCSVELTDSILSNKTNELQAAAAFICHTNGAASTIHRNFVSGTMEANSAAVTAPISGFISRLDNGSTMEHCYSLVDVHAQQVAGLADTVQGGAALEHSYYAGTLTRTDANTNWGAILANAGANANVKHCYYDATKNPVAKGYRGTDAVFKQDGGYTNWSTYGLTTQEMTSAASGAVWRSCYGHGHTSDGEAHPCEIDGDTQELQARTTAWNKGVWTYLPGLYPILKTQELDCSALTTAYVMPAATSLGLSAWDNVNQHFQLPAYGTMTWSVANNTLLLDSVSNKAQNKVDAHLYLGGPDVLSINCDDIHRQMQDIYVTRVDINSPADTTWYNSLSATAKTMIANQLYVDAFVPALLRNKEVTNISKKNAQGKYPMNGFDGDLHVWNREGSAGTVTNPRQYKVNGTITYYTGYTNPYIWQEVNIPYNVANTTVYRRFQAEGVNEYPIAARTSNLGETEDGGNFWLRSFASDAEIQYGGSVFQQGWLDPAQGDEIGHRPSVLRFPQTMKVGENTYLSGDYWCYAKENIIDEHSYDNGGSELRFYSTPGNTVYGTRDWSGHEDKRGAEGGYSFRVYGNPTLGNIQLEGYYWILEGEKRDTTGVNDSQVKPEFGTDVAQWFSLQQDPVIKPLGIWIDGPENFKDQALDEGTGAPLRLSPLHEPVVNEQFAEKEANFTASGHNGLLGVFSYVDQQITVYDPTGRLVFSAFVRANTGFTISLPGRIFIVRGDQSSRQVKVAI